MNRFSYTSPSVPVAYCQSMIGFQLEGGPHWVPLV